MLKRSNKQRFKSIWSQPTYLREQQPTVSAWSSSFSLPALNASLSKYRITINLTKKEKEIIQPNLCIYKQLCCGFRLFMTHGYTINRQLLFFILCFAIKIKRNKKLIQNYKSSQFFYAIRFTCSKFSEQYLKCILCGQNFL